MKKIEFVPFLLTEVTDIFSIRIDGDRLSEVQKFLVMFKDTSDPVLSSHIETLQSIDKRLNELGEKGNINDMLFNLTVEID